MRGKGDWRRRLGKPRRCAQPGCRSVAFPGLVYCYEHTSKDALAVLVEDCLRRGYRPGLLRVV